MMINSAGWYGIRSSMTLHYFTGVVDGRAVSVCNNFNISNFAEVFSSRSKYIHRKCKKCREHSPAPSSLQQQETA